MNRQQKKREKCLPFELFVVEEKRRDEIISKSSVAENEQRFSTVVEVLTVAEVLFFICLYYNRTKQDSRNYKNKWEIRENWGKNAYTRTRSYISGEYTNNKFEQFNFRINQSMLWKSKWELRSAIVPLRIEFESLSAFSDFIERDEGWRWGLRSEMKGEGEGWDRRWRVRVT